LAPIAEEFQKIVEEAVVDEGGFKGQNERLKELQERYRIIIDTYPAVPLSKSVLRILSLAASVPYISGLVPIAIDWLKSG